MAEWATELTLNIGKNVRALRGKQSGQWLADRTKELGFPFPRSSLSELENGKRRVITVPELLVLSAALDVPPVVLMFPGLPDAQTEVLPGVWKSSWEAVLWVVGEDPTPGDLPTQNDWITMLHLISKRRDLLESPLDAGDFWEPMDADQASKQREEQLAKARQKLAELNSLITGLGGVIQ